MIDVVLIVLGGMAAIAAVAYARSRVRLPVTSIAQANDATLVRIRGKVACASPLRSPYSGRECVYYKIELSSMQFNNRVHYEHVDWCELTVHDATGVARVARERAQFEAHIGDGEATRASRLSARGQALVHQVKWRLPEIAGVAIRESIIAVGDEVDVVGIPLREVQGAEPAERGFRDEPPTVLVFGSDVYVRKA